MTAPNIDDVAQTLAEYERLAITSGEWEGIDAPEFSADGDTWLQAWIPSEEVPHPAFARTVVYRKGMRPIVVVVSWVESVPADESWRALWLAKPMKLFGAYTLRAALRRAFRDVIGDRREPDEETGDPWAAPAAPCDWAAELDTTLTPDAVHDLHTAAKAARAMTPQLESAFRARLKYVEDGATRLLAAVQAEPASELSPEEAIRVAAFFEQDEKPTRPAPRDHLPPANRAARRAKSRKGRR